MWKSVVIFLPFLFETLVALLVHMVHITRPSEGNNREKEEDGRIEERKYELGFLPFFGKNVFLNGLWDWVKCYGCVSLVI